MNEKWEDVLTDAEERKVFEALADPEWDFRTIEGIQRSTHLPYERILDILRRHDRYIRKSLVPDAHGRDLYTLRSKDTQKLELFNQLRAFVTKSFS